MTLAALWAHTVESVLVQSDWFSQVQSHTVLPRCYAPPFCDLLSGKRGGGGVTTRTCAFASQLSPPPPIPRIRVLCSAVEDENSFDRHAVAVLKDEELLATYMLQNIAGSLAARLCPPAATAG